jgi:hypothetical protein
MKYFTDKGYKLESVKIMRDSNYGDTKNKGYGFLNFFDSNEKLRLQRE